MTKYARIIDLPSSLIDADYNGEIETYLNKIESLYYGESNSLEYGLKKYQNFERLAKWTLWRIQFQRSKVRLLLFKGKILPNFQRFGQFSPFPLQNWPFYPRPNGRRFVAEDWVSGAPGDKFSGPQRAADSPLYSL